MTDDTSRPTKRAALVWGGSRGIGAAVVARLAHEGLDVVFTSSGRSGTGAALQADLERRGLRVHHVPADATAPEAPGAVVSQVVSRLGRLDAVVCSAGVFPVGPIGAMTADQVEESIALHVRAPYLLAQAAAAHLGPGGSFVAIGSTLAHRASHAGLTLYATTKAALDGLTRSLARELGPAGVRANLVLPGNVDTDMNPASSDEAAAEVASIPLGRYARPDEVASAVAFLVSEQAAYLNGAAVTVDGGLTA